MKKSVLYFAFGRFLQYGLIHSAEVEEILALGLTCVDLTTVACAAASCRFNPFLTNIPLFHALTAKLVSTSIFFLIFRDKEYASNRNGCCRSLLQYRRYIISYYIWMFCSQQQMGSVAMAEDSHSDGYLICSTRAATLKRPNKSWYKFKHVAYSKPASQP